MSWLVIAVLAVASAACASEPLVQVDPATYRSELGAVCKQTDLQQAALTDPVDAATTAAFAQQVSTILTAEANATRALQVPADLDDDHRTFIQNTDDQARQCWPRRLSMTEPLSVTSRQQSCSSPSAATTSPQQWVSMPAEPLDPMLHNVGASSSRRGSPS
jgi:hypothetical protein